jgi:PAS domain S-box-containing protein
MVFANQVLARLLGARNPEELVGRPVEDFIHSDFRAAVIERNRQTIQQGLTFHLVEEKWLRRDGSAVDVEVTTCPFLYQGRPACQVVISDITKRRQAEQELRKTQEMLLQAQKMEAIGRLAGGVAHDFNNLLTVINGYSEMLLTNLPTEDPYRGPLEEISKSGQRAAALTKQMLAFSRRQIVTPKVLDLNAIVADANNMLRRLISENIDMELILGPGLWPVKADPGQIEQVLLNLAVNSRDAMPHGGRITIETANTHLGASDVLARAEVAPGPYVLLAVTDTGSGMDADTMRHIFEPFYTTKEVGKGTGLGLATVYGIVKQNQGHIDVASLPGMGARFQVFLPKSAPAEPAHPSRCRETRPPHGSETVLVVEDEASVRTLIRVVLEEQGYQVIEAKSGNEALQTLKTYENSVHLVLTDMVMPGMSGHQLAGEVTAMRPDLKVLFMSGYTEDSVFRHNVSDQGVDCLLKPFSPVSLAQKVRKVLDE